MARRPSVLIGIFDNEPEKATVAATEFEADVQPRPATARRPRQAAEVTVPAKRSSHPGKKPVLIHIPEDMHRTLRQLSVEEGGEPLTVITERLLRQYLVKRGHTKFAP